MSLTNRLPFNDYVSDLVLPQVIKQAGQVISIRTKPRISCPFKKSFAFCSPSHNGSVLSTPTSVSKNRPPLTKTAVPFSARSAVHCTIDRATSTGAFIGIPSSTHRFRTPARSCVSVAQGQMQFARTPYLAGAQGRRARMRPTTPCLAGEYAKRPGASVMPAIDETRQIDLEKRAGEEEEAPFSCGLLLAFMYARAIREKDTTLVRLISMCSFMGSGS